MNHAYTVAVQCRNATDPAGWGIVFNVKTLASCPAEARTKAREQMLREYWDASVVHVSNGRGG